MPRRQRMPYEGSKLSPKQSRDAIEKMLQDEDCKQFGWIFADGQYTLKFTFKVKFTDLEKDIAFMFAPPLIPKTVKQFNKDTGHYGDVIINDEIVAFRVLFWYLRNKFIAIKTGLFSVEEELMPHILVSLPDGRQTILLDRLRSQIPMLPGEAPQFKPLPELTKTSEEKVVEGETVQKNGGARAP